MKLFKYQQNCTCCKFEAKIKMSKNVKKNSIGREDESNDYCICNSIEEQLKLCYQLIMIMLF